jgi:hypothetical protein
MSEFHEPSNSNASMSTLMLVAVVILGLLYFLAKGCTNSSESHAPAAHGSVINVTNTQLLQS